MNSTVLRLPEHHGQLVAIHVIDDFEATRVGAIYRRSGKLRKLENYTTIRTVDM